MNKEYIHKDTRTDEPLQAQIETLTRWQDPTLYEKDKEIERLNNIIDELEKYIKHYDKIEGYYEYVECGYDEYNSDEDVKEQILDYIKELKEGK